MRARLIQHQVLHFWANLTFRNRKNPSVAIPSQKTGWRGPKPALRIKKLALHGVIDGPSLFCGRPGQCCRSVSGARISLERSAQEKTRQPNHRAHHQRSEKGLFDSKLFSATYDSTSTRSGSPASGMPHAPDRGPRLASRASALEPDTAGSR